MYKRTIQSQIEKYFFQGKIIVLSGARQVGKTTLAESILEPYAKNNEVRFLNCDNPTDRDLLFNKDLEFLQKIVGDAKILFIDEAQKVSGIGQTLKLLVDHFKKTKQIFVTGSSTINLLNHTQEALTGRKFVFTLFPLSVDEISGETKDYAHILRELETFLIFGTYPDIINTSSFEEKIKRLLEVAGSTLYKDIFEFQLVKHSSALRNLLKAIALQIGSEVSYTELGNIVGINKATVERYIDLLEQNLIIFRLPPYASNKRKTISKLHKVYFYDVGIRNAIIQNFNFIADRSDVGALFENFMIAERIKYQTYRGQTVNHYFWRTYDGAEVDLVEEIADTLYGYEFKWNEQKQNIKAPRSWQEYPNSSYSVITKNQLPRFLREI